MGLYHPFLSTHQIVYRGLLRGLLLSFATVGDAIYNAVV
jgi:hypothetical protein